MRYDGVNEIISEKEGAVGKEYEEIRGMVDLGEDLWNGLIEMRKGGGEIEFEISEGKVLVNKEGLGSDVVLGEGGEGEGLIEWFMLGGKERVGEDLNKVEVGLI